MSAKDYWNANLKLICGCLLVWFCVSYGFGIILVDWLNQVRFGGFMLGLLVCTAGQHFRLCAHIDFLRLANEAA